MGDLLARGRRLQLDRRPVGILPRDPAPDDGDPPGRGAEHALLDVLLRRPVGRGRPDLRAHDALPRHRARVRDRARPVRRVRDADAAAVQRRAGRDPLPRAGPGHPARRRGVRRRDRGQRARRHSQGGRSLRSGQEGDGRGVQPRPGDGGGGRLRRNERIHGLRHRRRQADRRRRPRARRAVALAEPAGADRDPHRRLPDQRRVVRVPGREEPLGRRLRARRRAARRQLSPLRARRSHLVPAVLLLRHGYDPHGPLRLLELDPPHGQHHHLQHRLGHRPPRVERDDPRHP